MQISRLTVFCGSSPGADPIHVQTAAELGEGAAELGGGEVLGVMTKALVDREIAHSGLTDLTVVETMHERKARMADLGDGFTMLPGGYGTLDEFCEALTWTQLGVHHKPCSVLDPSDYFAPLLALFERATEQRFISPQHRNLVLAARTVPDLLDQLAAWEPVHTDKWLDRDQR